jgi:hypothetical protein
MPFVTFNIIGYFPAKERTNARGSAIVGGSQTAAGS